MEPQSSNLDERDFRNLLRRLDSLPAEKHLPILLTLTDQQLLAICDES